MLSPEIARLRAKQAGLTRSRPPDDPELVETRRSLYAESLLERVKKIVAQAPPLTNEQIERVAALLRTGGA
ncbi:hypothetical protein [Mycobacteroides abscessus]|uniref:hypothetical protein n=1 Tax=Mycobacteroides abscessus TaxID=36809 RepID=UPI0021058D59|nr:hypothetical protein [Mycobacteroides abscessus]